MEIVNEAVFGTRYSLRESGDPTLQLLTPPKGAAARKSSDKSLKPIKSGEKMGKKDKGAKGTKSADKPADAPAQAPADGGEGKGKRGSKQPDPIVTDSINPFADLPTAPPTVAPTLTDLPPSSTDDDDKKKKDKKKKNKDMDMTDTDAAPIVFAPGQGAPPTAGKPGWRRVSTRQWIRDFREHIGKFQSYPYKPICGMFFWSFGYYPDMVPQDSYQRYIAKHPVTIKKHSVGSAEMAHGVMQPSAGMPLSSTTTSATSSVMDAQQANTNLPPLLPPMAAAGGPPEPPAGAPPPPDDTVSKSRKSKGGKGGKAAAAAAGAAAAADGAASEAGKSKTKGKGKVKPLSAVSGNMSFDPAVYDLSTLTVMNLPPGADAGKLKTLFPGAAITMENGGATVKFPNAAAAEPFLTKDATLDGQALVVSPKLKA